MTNYDHKNGGTISTIDNSMSEKPPPPPPEDKPEAGTIRTAFPQFLACMAKNLLLFDIGLALAFPTIAIPALRGMQKDRNPDETLYFTPEQSTWFASIAMLVQPIGSILSGGVTEPLGRKIAMIIVNAPMIGGWLLLHMATSVTQVYIAAALLGLGIGFMEASILTYVGEISHPSVRGILLAFTNVALVIPNFVIYSLGAAYSWRTVALICMFCPIITIGAIILVPETPYWLLSKKRFEDAMASLQWLRGWVSPKGVEKEFDEMKRYMEASNACTACDRANLKCTHKTNHMEKIKELFRTKAMRPFILIILCFAVMQLNALAVLRPYMVQVFRIFQLPIDPNMASIAIGCIDIITNIFCVFVVKQQGKRRLFLLSIMGCATCCFALSINAFYLLPLGSNSFDSVVSEDSIRSDNYFGFVMFILLAFSSGICQAIPWMMLSEIFPFKVRGTATGLAAACNYIIMFIVTKTYLDLERTVSLAGVFLFYGVIGIGGFIIHYLILPETEGRTLEEIENFFSNKARKLTDRKVQIIAKSSTSPTTSAMSTNMAAAVQSTDNMKNGMDNKGYV